MEQKISLQATPVFLKNRTAKIKLFLWKFLLHLQNNARWVKGIWRLSKLRNWVIKENEYLPLPYNELTIWISPGNIMDRDLLHGIPYEPDVVRAISKFITEGFSYLDVGAYIGLHLVMAVSHRVNSEQQFIGIEPAPITYKVLEKNIQSNKLHFVEVINCGLGNINTKANLYLSATNNKGMHSLFPSDTMKEHVEIEIKLLDDLLTSPPTTPWLIKIDAEGSEISVLDGGNFLLSSIEDLAMIVEVHPENLSRAGNSIETLVNRLKKIGCKLFVLEDLHPITGEADFLSWLEITKKPYTNLLCIKGKFSSSVLKGLQFNDH